MGTSLELLVPLAIASYAGWADWNKCTGPADPNPYVATFCSNLRDSMNEACTSVLSIPLPSTGVQLTARRKITPIAFGEQTKSTIKATYGACSDFWTGKISYVQYRTRLEENAAKLDLLYAAVAPEGTASPFRDPIASATISNEKVFNSSAQLKDEVDKCMSKAFPCDAEAPALAATKNDLKELEARLVSEIASLRRSHPGPVSPPPQEHSARPGSGGAWTLPNQSIRWTLVTEVAFASASATLKYPETCSRISGRLMAHLPPMPSGPLLVRVVGYADPSGASASNRDLSNRRSETVLQCLSKVQNPRLVLKRPEGAGEIQAPAELRTLARRASIYVGIETGSSTVTPLQ